MFFLRFLLLVRYHAATIAYRSHKKTDTSYKFIDNYKQTQAIES